MGEWEDTTSYSRDDSYRIPSVWTLRLTRDAKITVVRVHRFNPTSWVFHCSPWFDTHSLDLAPTSENRDEAMSRALSLVRAEVQKLATALEGVSHD